LAGRTPKILLTIPPYSANENARLSNKKTISPQDVISALKDAELEEFIPRLEAELKSKLSSS
jgi:ABC-type transport system involved in cytochrome bd biosynthesis fused ATPase/permease subunit